VELERAKFDLLYQFFVFVRYVTESRRAMSHDYSMINKSPDQNGKVYVKFYWWPLIISIIFSILLSVFLNIVF
jgi:hypothetical protein